MAIIKNTITSKLLSTLIIWFSLFGGFVWAQTTEKSRASTYVTKMELISIGDEEGHVVGLFEKRGLGFHDSGEISIITEQGTFDYVNGSGPHQGYTINTYEDGSKTVLKFQGTTTQASEGTTSLLEGTFEIINGSGRFEGIEGDGSYTGKRLTTLTKEGARGDTYVDGSSNYTLPSQ